MQNEKTAKRTAMTAGFVKGCFSDNGLPVQKTMARSRAVSSGGEKPNHRQRPGAARIVFWVAGSVQSVPSRSIVQLQRHPAVFTLAI